MFDMIRHRYYLAKAYYRAALSLHEATLAFVEAKAPLIKACDCGEPLCALVQRTIRYYLLFHAVASRRTNLTQVVIMDETDYEQPSAK